MRRDLEPQTFHCHNELTVSTLTQQALSIDSNADTLRQITRSVSLGIAIVDPGSWEILFENPNFFKWFPPGDDVDEPLTARPPGFNPGRAQTRINDGRTYSFETESSPGR